MMRLERGAGIPIVSTYTDAPEGVETFDLPGPDAPIPSVQPPDLVDSTGRIHPHIDPVPAERMSGVIRMPILDDHVTVSGAGYYMEHRITLNAKEIGSLRALLARAVVRQLEEEKERILGDLQPPLPQLEMFPASSGGQEAMRTPPGADTGSTPEAT